MPDYGDLNWDTGTSTTDPYGPGSGWGQDVVQNPVNNTTPTTSDNSGSTNYSDYGSSTGVGAPGTSYSTVKNPDGTVSVVPTPTTTTSTTPTTSDNSGLAALLKGLGTTAGTALSTPAGLLTALAGLYALNGGNTAKPFRGYTGGIPVRTATRTPLANTTPAPEYGARHMGKQYMSDVTYAAEGGIMHGKDPKYLNGSTDGMADKISTSIDGHQAAALSHGEFVIPADVVSHLGNGNSDAGADVLYKMMDKVRQARTGTKKQGKEINPAKFTPGGIAGYAGGGVVAFDTGGATTPITPAVANPTSSESNLSEWAGPYIADYLSKGQALANTPYQAYTGPLTAGASPLQTQAFGIASNLSTPASMGQASTAMNNVINKMGDLSYTGQTAGNQFSAPAAYSPTSFSTGTFGEDSAKQYMNPYLQQSLDPQLAEARRQSQITQMGNAAKLAQAGAYGGSRGALMDTETQRNLGTNLANITGQGYNTAYTNAMSQFNADQARKLQADQYGELSKQFGANQAMTAAQAAAQYGQAAQAQNMQEQQFGASYGLNALNGISNAALGLGSLGTQQNAMNLNNLNALSGLGSTQHDLEAQNVAADKAQWETEQQDPYKKIQFQQSLMNGLPVGTTTNSTSQSGTSQLGQIGSGLQSLYDTLKGLNLGG